MKKMYSEAKSSHDKSINVSAGQAGPVTIEGSINEFAGTIKESAETINESAGTTNEPAGTINESAGMTNESAGTIHKSAGMTNESAGPGISWVDETELLESSEDEAEDGTNRDNGGSEGPKESDDVVVPPENDNANGSAEMKKTNETPAGGNRKRPGRGPKDGKKAKAVKRKSEILMTVTKLGEEYEPFQSLNEKEHNELIEHLDEVVSELQVHEGDFLPSIDFVTFKNGRTIIGCGDEITQKWLQDETKNFRVEYEAWNRERTRPISAIVQFPTGRRDPRDIIQAIYTRYRLDGRMQILRTRLTASGRFLLLGVDEKIFKQLEDRGFSVHVGLCRVDFKKMDQFK